MESQQNKTIASRRLTLGISLALVLVVGLVWYFRDTLLAPDEKPFVVMKAWSEAPDATGSMSPGFEWLHRQCHEPLANLDPDGQLRKRGAADISRSGSRVWTFKLRADSRWSDDGSSVTVQDYIKAWDLRKGVVSSDAFKRIKELKALDLNTISVELAGDEDKRLDGETLSSLWLSAIKSSTTGTWSYLRELDGPCDGPYVISGLTTKEAILRRNKYWYAHNPEMLSRVKMILKSNSNSSTAPVETPRDLFTKGILSFVEPNISSNPVGQNLVAVSGRVFLEPLANYLIINPKGLVGGDLMGFVHAAINRGELSALISRPDALASMYHVLPLSFSAFDEFGQALQQPPQNLESVKNANKIIGIKGDQVASKIPAPLKRKLIILSSRHERLQPVVQRFSDRLGANYNISCEMVTPSEDGKLPASWDVAFVDISLENGLSGWAKNMITMLNHYAPGQSELISKLSVLSKEPAQSVMSRQALMIATEIDNLAPKSSVIVPVGQLGSEVLLEEGVLDVSWMGDSKRDPDVSRARRIKKGTKG